MAIFFASAATTLAAAARNGAGCAPGAGVVARLMIAMMLSYLCACTNPNANARASSSPPEPGTFTVHMGGDMTTYVGVARP